MAQTPEGKVKKKVRDLLNRLGIWHYLPANNGYGRHGIPDFVAIVNGQFVGIEVKADRTKKPTALQIRCGEEITAAGGVWFLVYDDGTLATLEAYIKTTR